MSSLASHWSQDSSGHLHLEFEDKKANNNHKTNLKSMLKSRD